MHLLHFNRLNRVAQHREQWFKLKLSDSDLNSQLSSAQRLLEEQNTQLEERYEIKKLDQGFFRMTQRYGFMEETDIPAALAQTERRRRKAEENYHVAVSNLREKLAKR